MIRGRGGWTLLLCVEVEIVWRLSFVWEWRWMVVGWVIGSVGVLCKTCRYHGPSLGLSGLNAKEGKSLNLRLIHV